MQININGKDYTFKFGIGFLRKLDEKYTMEERGIKFGAGLEMKAPFLLQKHTVVLSELLLMANKGHKPELAQNTLDDYLDAVDNIDEVFDEVIGELENANATKMRMAEFKKSIEETSPKN